jgi:hypothetical protein
MSSSKTSKRLLYSLIFQINTFSVKNKLVLGKYIDKGNYAQVYECIRKDNGQKRAVKVLEK